MDQGEKGKVKRGKGKVERGKRKEKSGRRKDSADAALKRGIERSLKY